MISNNFQVSGSLVVAACESTGGIGLDGTLPWPRLNDDMRHFHSLTSGSPVLMGSGTYNSLPKSVRPLPNRLNIVLSTRSREELGLPDCVLLANSFEAARELLEQHGEKKVYVIGGESVFKAALQKPEWSKRVYLTVIHSDFKCDRFLPISDITASDAPFTIVSSSQGHVDADVKYTIREYLRQEQVPTLIKRCQPHEEYQYLDLVRKILHEGVIRGDRTGTGTMSLFGVQMRFDLRSSFPLLTTKRVFWRGVVEELLWFIRGSTDATQLSARGVHIWDANGSREFLDSRGLTHREVGDLGPVYGFQWRHFGAEYSDMHTDYTGKGADQLAQIIHTLRTNPNDRRMIMSAWNPAAVNEMALPPCHLMVQFYVANNELSCLMFQRSADMGLGVPFNIASYALLTCLIADVTGLKRGEFVHVIGDAHIYCNHQEALRKQLEREPRSFPTLNIRHRDNIDDFCLNDLTLKNYEPHDSIPMKMAV